MKKTALPQLLKLILMLLIVMTPLIVGMVLMQQTQGVSLFRAYPFWSDEIWYWHQANSFAAVGFDSGYYSIQEVPAPADFSPFNTWGVFIPMVYGSIGAVVGWGAHSLVMINMVLLTIAVALLVWAMRPSWIQLVLLGGLLATYPPIILYGYASMLPIMQMAIGLTLAAGFVVLLRQREATPRPVIWALIMGIGLASLIRLTWAFFYFPFVLLFTSQITWRRIGVAFGVTSVAFIGAAMVFMVTGAPYPNVLNEVSAALREGMGQGIAIIWDNMRVNISLLDDGNLFEITYRQQFALFTGLLMLLGGWLWFRRQQGHETGEQLNAVGMILYILGVFALLTVLIYDVKLSRDFRLFAPILLFGFVVVIAYRWWVIIVPVAITIGLMMPETQSVYNIWTDWHTDPADLNAYYAWGAEFDKVIEYDADAPNDWCNTLLHSHGYLWTQTYVLMSIPAGIGLSTTFEQHDMPPPYRSRWLLMTDDELSQYRGAVDVVPLMDAPMGTLYYNADSACPVVPDIVANQAAATQP